MSPDRRRTLGALGEQVAEEHLLGAGYRLIERNFRTRSGELDLILDSGRCLVFCEVKTRVAETGGGPGGPLASIGPNKQRRVRMMAREWLATRSAGGRPSRPELRFDAIGVTLTRRGTVVSLEHLEAAF